MKLSEAKLAKSNTNPLYKLERKLNLKTLIIFTIVAAVLTFIFTVMFNLVSDMGKQILEVFKDNKEIYDMMEKMLSTSNPASYFVAQSAQVWGLIGAIYAMFLGCKLVTGNLKDGSYEMLYTMELSRTKILLTKFARMLINLLIFNVVVACAGFIGLCCLGIGQINILNFLLYFLIVTFVCIQVGVLSFGLSCLFKRKYGTILSIALVIVLYFIANMSITGGNFAFLEYLSPLTAMFAGIVSDGIGALNYISLIIWTIVPIMVVLLGFESFKKSDII